MDRLNIQVIRENAQGNVLKNRLSGITKILRGTKELGLAKLNEDIKFNGSISGIDNLIIITTALDEDISESIDTVVKKRSNYGLETIVSYMKPHAVEVNI